MCHMALTESVDTTLRSVVTLQNEGHVRWATVWEQTCPRAVIEGTWGLSARTRERNQLDSGHWCQGQDQADGQENRLEVLFILIQQCVLGTWCFNIC